MEVKTGYYQKENRNNRDKVLKAVSQKISLLEYKYRRVMNIYITSWANNERKKCILSMERNRSENNIELQTNSQRSG